MFGIFYKDTDYVLNSNSAGEYFIDINHLGYYHFKTYDDAELAFNNYYDMSDGEGTLMIEDFLPLNLNDIYEVQIDDLVIREIDITYNIVPDKRYGIFYKESSYFLN